MININGKLFESDSIKLSDYLVQNKLNSKRIAIELNGKILPKSQYDNTVLKDGDKAEIVNFVGGG